MIKRIISFLLLTQVVNIIYAQSSKAIKDKPPVDFEAIESWPSIGGTAISNNGQYAWYYIINQPVHNGTLVVLSTKNNWKKEIIGANDAAFSEDCKKVIFKTLGDSLCILTLGSEQVEYITGIKSFKIFAQGKKEYLVYHVNTHENKLVLQEIEKGRTKSFNNVSDYFISKNGYTLLLLSKINNEEKQALNWVQLPEGEEKHIWEGEKAGNFVFDNEGTQLAFLVEQTINGKNEKSFWYYKNGTDEAKILLDNKTIGIDCGSTLSEIDRFSGDGVRLFFWMKSESPPVPNSNSIMVDVWTYFDSTLQSQQLKKLDPNRWDNVNSERIMAVFNISTHHTILLQEKGEQITRLNELFDEFFFVSHMKGDWSEASWNIASRPANFTISSLTGERKPINMALNENYMSVSPNGKYLLLTNTSGIKNIFSYEISTGQIRNLTVSLPIPPYDNEIDYPISTRFLSTAAWFKDGNTILIYDQFDIWKIDLSGKAKAENITNGLGRKQNIVFRLTGDIQYRSEIIDPSNLLILTAFDNNTKENGFFCKKLEAQGDPIRLTMGPYWFYHPTVDGGHSFAPIKARDANVYIVSRESMNDSPNYFVTKDFQHFIQLSNVNPEKSYNWMTSELITYNSIEGTARQGVLYKPEGFNPNTKHPIIFNVYEKFSQRLNTYTAPYYSPGWINIPWFVSHGYLVFSPDVAYKTGEAGQNALNTILDLASYLSKSPWIDSTKMGIHGHSWGAYETNYIITHTSIFAAAVSVSGYCNLVSSYGSIAFEDGQSLQSFYESGQNRIGSTLWEKPELYIKNSPIFYADKVTTPLLMMNNEKDGIVPFSQGMEFFLALRRLGKKVWMLQYDGEVHSVIKKKAKKDLTIRMTQFLDHYLKGALPPIWMTRGLPAKSKGIYDGLDLDRQFNTPPKEGLLNSEEKKNVEALQNRKPIVITF